MSEITFRNVESGYAEVWRGNLKRGTVCREKHGSTRTGTIWTAYNLSQSNCGTGYTRDEAVARLLAAPRIGKVRL